MSATLPFITFNQAIQAVKHCFKTGLTPMLHGSPSNGKTAIAYKIAKEANLVPVLFSLMDHEPTDLVGLPDLSGKKAVFKPFDTFPVEGDEVPEGKNGWLIILDEYSSGTRAMQAASNKLLYERMVGNKPLHSNAFVIGCGNLATDNAYVVEEPAHTKSRRCNLYVKQDVGEWVTWAFSAGIDTRVIAYAEMKPTSITVYSPDNVDINYACARTLEQVSKCIKGEKIDRWMLPILQGYLGTGSGLEFYNFCMLTNELPTLKEILGDPEGVNLPTRANYRYALAGMLIEYINSDNLEVLMKVISRLPSDTQYFIMRGMYQRNRELGRHPLVVEWSKPIIAKYCK